MTGTHLQSLMGIELAHHNTLLYSCYTYDSMYRRDAALTRPAVGQTAGSCSPNMAACRTCMCPNSVGARVTLTWQTITQYERCWGPLLDQQIIGCVARWPLGNRILA